MPADAGTRPLLLRGQRHAYFRLTTTRRTSPSGSEPISPTQDVRPLSVVMPSTGGASRLIHDTKNVTGTFEFFWLYNSLQLPVMDVLDPTTTKNAAKFDT